MEAAEFSSSRAPLSTQVLLSEDGGSVPGTSCLGTISAIPPQGQEGIIKLPSTQASLRGRC